MEARSLDLTDTDGFKRTLRYIRLFASYKDGKFDTCTMTPKETARRLTAKLERDQIASWEFSDGVFMVYFKTGGHCFYMN